jgi:hypothetical protein
MEPAEFGVAFIISATASVIPAQAGIHLQCLVCLEGLLYAVHLLHDIVAISTASSGVPWILNNG